MIKVEILLAGSDWFENVLSVKMGPTFLWSLLACLVLVSGNPRGHPSRPVGGAASGRNNVGAFSAASYASLGIQPSPRSLGKPKIVFGTH